MEAVRGDGASVLAALAILSENKACIRFALTQGPTRLDGQDTLDVCPFVQRLALAFFDPARIFAWLRGGAAPSALVAEIGVLLLSADLGAAVKDQLEDVRAFPSHHEDLLGDRSRWPVPQVGGAVSIAVDLVDVAAGEIKSCKRCASHKGGLRAVPRWHGALNRGCATCRFWHGARTTPGPGQHESSKISNHADCDDEWILMGKRQQRPIPSVYELQWECGLLPLYTIQVNILYLL